MFGPRCGWWMNGNSVVIGTLVMETAVSYQLSALSFELRASRSDFHFYRVAMLVMIDWIVGSLFQDAVI